MIEINSSEIKTKFGKYLEESKIAPIIIKKSGRKVAVLTSYEEYEKLKSIEDYYWGEIAKNAEKEGYVGIEKSLKLITEKLKEK